MVELHAALQRGAALSACSRSLFLSLESPLLTPPDRVPPLQRCAIRAIELFYLLALRSFWHRTFPLVLYDPLTTSLASYQRIHIRIIFSGHGEEKEASLGTSHSRRSARYPVKTNTSASAPV
jgi:hypothetical protein